MFVRVLLYRLSIRTFHFLALRSLHARSKNLLAAIHAGRLIETVREAEIAALLILHNIHIDERVVRSAIVGVSARMAHSD